MEVMYNYQEALLIILEVLLYDFFNNWIIFLQKAVVFQGRRDRMDIEIFELNVIMDIDNVNISVYGGLILLDIIVIIEQSEL